MRRQFVLLLLSAVLLTTQVAALGPSDEKESKSPPESPRVQTRLRLGGIHVGAGLLYSSGYPYLPWWRSYYDPLFYDPFFACPAAFPLYRSGTNRDHVGRVKLKNLAEDAQVFIDGGLAGSGADLKSFYLDPGAYSLSIQRRGYESFEMKLYVLSGKTLHIEVPVQSEVKP
jgi:hypothetical protein